MSSILLIPPTPPSFLEKAAAHVPSAAHDTQQLQHAVASPLHFQLRTHRRAQKTNAAPPLLASITSRCACCCLGGAALTSAHVRVCTLSFSPPPRLALTRARSCNKLPAILAYCATVRCSHACIHVHARTHARAGSLLNNNNSRSYKTTGSALPKAIPRSPQKT